MRHRWCEYASEERKQGMERRTSRSLFKYLPYTTNTVHGIAILQQTTICTAQVPAKVGSNSSRVFHQFAAHPTPRDSLSCPRSVSTDFRQIGVFSRVQALLPILQLTLLSSLLSFPQTGLYFQRIYLTTPSRR